MNRSTRRDLKKAAQLVESHRDDVEERHQQHLKDIPAILVTIITQESDDGNDHRVEGELQ